jgi:2-hydroxychromene-2-carboxylate isomerase
VFESGGRKTSDEFARVLFGAVVFNGMGELIVLAERRADRSRPTRSARPALFFDLSCPFSYLVAERIERLLGGIDWIPTAATILHRGNGEWGQPAAVRAHAETCAVALRLPLVWPDRFPAATPMALRAAVHAAQIGAGAQFALAAMRLAFCGGFDLEDPEILAEAAAAAGISLQECLAAAGDPTRDGELHATARGLLSQGVTRLPAIRVGTGWFDGDGALAAAAAALRSQAASSPLAPAG